MDSRIKTYGQISTELACLSDRQLSQTLDQAKSMHTGIGGQSLLLTVKQAPVFVKKVPLTDLEMRAENTRSTANLFGLPLCCQYGIGSPGFGAWRELAAHIMTTNWVIAGDCPNFPILYHWRVLPRPRPEPLNIAEWGSFENYATYWENSLEVLRRAEAINSASSEILLFLEYVPQTLYAWLSSRLSAEESVARSAIKFVEKNLKATNDFMNYQNFVHFDAHFENILTDGKLIYVSDFGLALSSKFDLSNAEIEFFNTHKNYDQYNAALYLLHCVITSLFGKETWRTALQDCLNGDGTKLAPAVASVIKQYGQIALTMDKFYQKLQKETKQTSFPATELERLWAEVAPA